MELKKKEEGAFYKEKTLPSLLSSLPLSPSIPDQIGPYRIEAFFAKGGMSLLYLGIDTKNKRPCILKLLAPEWVNHPEMLDHFLFEAKIIALTNHPHIVKLYDYGKSDIGLYICMEFIRGVSLCQFIAKQSFSLRRSLQIILQISYALCHLHAHGVIHRDLKPENILISEEGEVKVIDFGIAQLHETEKSEGSSLSAAPYLVGTPSYMSPEQKENPSHVSFASDIYSLGIIAYELIVGKLSHGMIYLERLPPLLQKIIGKTVAFSPEERYQDIVYFITDLTAYINSAAIETERSNLDHKIELLELLQRADQTLLCSEIPHWPQFDIAFAKSYSTGQTGLYFECFKLAPYLKGQQMVILIGQALSLHTANSIIMAELKGMIKTLIAPYLEKETLLFRPTEFISLLNTMVTKESFRGLIHLDLVHLFPLQNRFSLVSCGMHTSLFHIRRGGQEIRLISADNPLLGAIANHSFIETTDTFIDGELIVLSPLSEKSDEALLEQKLKKFALFSPERLAEAFVKHGSEEEFPLYPQSSLCIQRLG